MLRSETAAEPARTAAALKGLRAYQQAARGPAPPPRPIVARAGRAVVRDYGGTGAPILFVPSLINPPDILDLDADRSLLRWLAGQGHRVLMVDWGAPAADERDLTLADHVATLLVPLIDALGERVALAGYCLGGTMAIAAAMLRPPRALALIAAPWRFAGYPAETPAALDALWRQSAAAAEAIGLLPMEILQAAFWRIDPARTIAKFEALGRRAPGDPAADAFVRLEDWANDGPPLTFATARELLIDLYLDDRTGRGAWRVDGQAIDPAAIAAPILDIVSTTDRIVPAAAAAGIGERHPVALGHVGMIVGGQARARLWQPLSGWLSRAGAS